MPWDDSLDPNGVHYRIAASDHPRIGVLAGPGTGKTRYALMRRVARLVEQRRCEPEEILLVTFTRTAAQDLVSKLEELRIPGIDRVLAGTLHGFCLGLLQRDAVLQATRRVPRMLLEHEADLMLRDIGAGFGDIYERRRRLKAFEAGWARRAADHPGLALAPDDQSFEAQVVSWLRHHRAMLIGEVVPLAYQYLRNHPAAEERTRFRHVIVDEYQDLNRLEQELTDLLVDPGAAICVFGDDDQSIYRFRYAHPEGIVQFVVDGATERHDIDQCGRCPQLILNMANRLMHAAPGRAKGDLVCTQESPGTVAIVQWESLSAEIEGVVAAIIHDVHSHAREPGDFIVLVHRRRIGYRIRDALSAADIQARSFFLDDALRQSPRAQLALALLRLLGDRTDRASLRVWLGFGDQTGRASAYARLREAALPLGISEYDLLGRVSRGEVRLAVSALTRRYRDLEDRLAAMEDRTLLEVVELLFPEDDPDIRGLREEALGLAGLAGTVRALADELVRAISQPEIPQSPDFVRIMSLHKSKGLTSKVVHVVTALDGVIPTIPDAADEEERAASYNEHRRLFYVAITRSCDELLISYPWQMDFADATQNMVRIRRVRTVSGQRIADCLATPYLRELGDTAPAPVVGRVWLEHRLGGT